MQDVKASGLVPFTAQAPECIFCQKEETDPRPLMKPAFLPRLESTRTIKNAKEIVQVITEPVWQLPNLPSSGLDESKRPIMRKDGALSHLRSQAHWSLGFAREKAP